MKLDDINITKISTNCISLTFNNINHLVDIVGKNDENLYIIEKQLSIETIPKGNKIQISGNFKTNCYWPSISTLTPTVMAPITLPSLGSTTDRLT